MRITVSEAAYARLIFMRLGKYDILDEVGRGGMGVVYRGFDPVLQRTVAVKTIGRANSDGVTERRLNEARAAAKLTHPMIGG